MKLNEEAIRSALKETEEMRYRLEAYKREVAQLTHEKTTLTKDYNSEYRKKVFLVDIARRLIEKIEKPIQNVFDDSLRKIDHKEDFENEYKYLIAFLEAKRVCYLLRRWMN